MIARVRCLSRCCRPATRLCRAASRGASRAARAQRQQPLGNQWVVLHRVGRDRSGPLDSMRTSARGTFAFRYRATGDSAAIYFATTSYGGIVYPTAPFRGPVVSGDDASITVFDTTSGPVAIKVGGHHIIVGAPQANGRRPVGEVYDLQNDSTVTVDCARQRHPGVDDADSRRGDGLSAEHQWRSGERRGVATRPGRRRVRAAQSWHSAGGVHVRAADQRVSVEHSRGTAHRRARGVGAGADGARASAVAARGATGERRRKSLPPVSRARSFRRQPC